MPNRTRPNDGFSDFGVTPGVDFDLPWEYGRGWPKLPDLSGMYDADEYGREFAAPTSVDAGSMFSRGRESENVEDHRGQINNVWAGMGLGDRPLTDQVESPQENSPQNRHTDAVDGFIARLGSYAPSRASLLNPSSIRKDTALDMSAYYEPVRRAHDAEYAQQSAEQKRQTLLDDLIRRRRPED